MLPRGICHLLAYVFLLIYELQNFQCFSKQFFAWDIDNFSAFFLKFECFQFKEGVIMYRTAMVLRMYRLVLVSSFFLIFCKDNSEMLKAFEKTIEFFHDVLQRNVTAANTPPPQTNIWRFSWTKSICEASLNWPHGELTGYSYFKDSHGFSRISKITQLVLKYVGFVAHFNYY
jgi:hypothetical protein